LIQGPGCYEDCTIPNSNLSQEDWSIRENPVPGEECVRNQQLVDKDKILLPPLHIKLGLLKDVIKAMNKYGQDFEYLREKFPKFNDAKLKEMLCIWRKFVKSLIYLNTC
jgi:hypothetical protein